MNKATLIMISMLFTILLTACGSTNQAATLTADHHDEHQVTADGGNHSGMSHSSDGELPNGLKTADNEKFTEGSKAIIVAEHMEGMNGAEATIVGAYETIVYSVSYTPTDSGEAVNNHKWVIHEEIANATKSSFSVGDFVELEASHMVGMEGTQAVIDSAQKTNVYMVDYQSTTGESVKNHKWVIESELQ